MMEKLVAVYLAALVAVPLWAQTPAEPSDRDPADAATMLAVPTNFQRVLEPSAHSVTAATTQERHPTIFLVSGAEPGPLNLDLNAEWNPEFSSTQAIFTADAGKQPSPPQYVQVIRNTTLEPKTKFDLSATINAKYAALLFDSPGAAITGVDSPEDRGDNSIAATTGSKLAPEQPQEKVQWGHLVKGSLAGLAVMNAYRIGTEPSTRVGLHNSVVGGYFHALGAMHGWSDGDGYYENYLGHPIEGATAGYLWIHNDPRYNRVEFGKDRDYWMSRLRAYGFAWAFSEQFEIGLISEASVGQIQRYCCAYGFVDHVITPNAGMVWLVGGDILDKYVTRRIEDRFRNQWVRAAARVALNFPEAFANVFSFEVPWYRDNRPGVRDYDGQLYPAFKPATVKPDGDSGYSQVPSFELTAVVPSYLQMGKNSCVGGGGTGAFRVANEWQWTMEVSGCSIVSFPKNWSGDSLTFTTGPQWILHTASRWSPHMHVRIGGHKVTEGYEDQALKKQALDALPPGKNPNSVYYDYVTRFETTGLSLSVGGGLDVRLNRAFAVQLPNFDYVRSWLEPLNGVNFNHGFRFSTGLVLRVGTW